MACPDLDIIINKFNVFTKKPVKFLTVQSDVKEDIKNLVKSVYDYTKVQEKVDKKTNKSALLELIVQDFDEEQIWQQVELQNTECWDQLVWEVANCISTKTDLKFPVTISTNLVESEHESDNEKDISEPEAEESETEPKKKFTEPLRPKSKIKLSIVDDQFFKLQDMANFLNHVEKNEGKQKSDSEDSIDMFEDIDDDDSADEDGGKAATYNDFFSDDMQEVNEHENGFESNDEDDEMDMQEINRNTEYDKDNNDVESNGEEDESEVADHKTSKDNKKVRFETAESSDDESEKSDSKIQITQKQINETKSEFEQRQQRLKLQIEKLEEKTLSEAPWQLKGEVDATKRPQNSLLEEVVDFDLTSRPPPIITEQTTLTLEDIIRRRIKDKAWDDVEKKEKPVNDQLVFRKPAVLDHAKSEKSLAQVYEAEYLKQKQVSSGEVAEEKEPEAHTEVREAMSKLFAKLDALCHYHYTPKAPQADVKIVSNTPAISMEEVAPVATSDAVLLAPEEIKRKRKGELISKDERSQTDKKRERRKKKKLQHGKLKVNQVTDQRNTTKAVEGNEKAVKTSKAFFTQLNSYSK